MFLSACLLAALPGAGGVNQFATAIAPTADGKMLFVAMSIPSATDTTTGYVCVWDLTKPELKAVVPGVPNGIHLIRPSADGSRFVAISGARPKLEVYDTATKKLLHKFDTSKVPLGVAAVSPDGNWLAYHWFEPPDDGRISRITPNVPRVQVWDTKTGNLSPLVQLGLKGASGTPAFSPDSTRLILALPTGMGCAEFDLKTGKKLSEWKHDEPKRDDIYTLRGDHHPFVILPNGKGTVSVSPTGKRRETYVVRLVTEKKDWMLGEFLDYGSPPVVSPDGRLLIVSGGSARTDSPSTFILKLDPDGNPELEEKTDKSVGPGIATFEKKVLAWREWTLGEANRAGREYPGRMGFSPDGKRMFVANSLGSLYAVDTESRERKATLFAWIPKKDEVPPWHILTKNEVVGSRQEVEAYLKDGKKEDAAKVKEALGVK